MVVSSTRPRAGRSPKADGRRRRSPAPLESVTNGDASGANGRARADPSLEARVRLARLLEVRKVTRRPRRTEHGSYGETVRVVLRAPARAGAQTDDEAAVHYREAASLFPAPIRPPGSQPRRPPPMWPAH